jgi:group I intron endonuclease
MSQYAVYLITCAASGKRYVGLTKTGAQKRLRTHIYNAYANQGGALYAAIRKYGCDAFSVEVLRDGLTQEQAEAAEIELIASHGTHAPGGYNITLGGEGAFGVVMSAETRSRMSEAHKLRQADPELRARTSAALTGKPKTAEHNAKVSAANIGKTVSPEARAKISAKLTGHVQSVETIEKRAAKLRGRKRSPHLAGRLGDLTRGVPKSAEQRAKLSLSVSRYFSARAWRQLIEAHGHVSVRHAA